MFDRIRENVPRMPSAAFSQIVNRSMSEVIVRSLATSFCTLLPVLALFFFGGETLQDFAFALIVGTLSGTYSSVFIAGPVLTHWKERESVYRARQRRIREAYGFVPAYAVAVGGAPVDVEPRSAAGAPARSPRIRPRACRARSSRTWSPTSAWSPTPLRPPPRRPPGRAPDGARRAGGGRARRAPEAVPPRAAARARARLRAATPGSSRRVGRGCAGGAEEAAQPAAREAPLMGALVWVMIGLAIWHFTIFIPDRFWGGIVGAFVGALVGSVLLGWIISGFSVPGQDETDLLTAFEAVPGALLGISAVYFYGASRGNEPV